MTEITAQDILKRYKEIKNQGTEPINKLAQFGDELEGWSNLRPDERITLTQLRFLSKTFNCPMIEEEIILPYLKYGLSVGALAREQFGKAHTGLLEQLKPLLAGIDIKDEKEIKR